VAGEKINFVKKVSEFGEAIMVSSDFGFSTAYMKQFWARTFRCAINMSSEGDALHDVWASDQAPGVADKTWRHNMSAALFYMLRIKDIETGSDTGSAAFNISKPNESSALYNNTQRNAIIFDAARDDPSFGLKAVTSVVTDGNSKTTRKLTPAEASTARNRVGRPRKTKDADTDTQGCKDYTRCKSKVPVKLRGRTAGLYLTMNASAKKGEDLRIVELREMVDNESNKIRQASLLAVKRVCPRLRLWIHDLACRANFASKIVKRRMLDLFHDKCHTDLKCKRLYNPKTKKNAALLKAHKVHNTSICEQMWRFFNKHWGSRFMALYNYRAFWRHICMEYNKSAKSRNHRLILKPSLQKKLR